MKERNQIKMASKYDVIWKRNIKERGMGMGGEKALGHLMMLLSVTYLFQQKSYLQSNPFGLFSSIVKEKKPSFPKSPFSSEKKTL